ncbi:MAG TPA: SDR family NAD(P)-dependent oxidoreductase [Vicinamibacteria bacterium]|nr:SDR family NAD(P)-dependent oxidoreductase [Vicinamibacteria bacterium]
MVGKVAALLKELGDAVVTVSPGEAYAASPAGYIVNPERPEDLRRLLSEAGAGRPWRGVVHLWSLDAPAPTEGGAALREAQRLGIGSVSQVVEALVDEEGEPPRLWLVTAGTQRLSSVEDAPGLAQAPLWGLGRVLAREHPALRCTMVDLSPASGEAELRSLRDELRQDGSEDQVALRGGGRYVARLAARSTEGAAAPLGRAGARPEPASGRPYRAVIAKPGGLNHLGLRAAVRRAPSRGQVEIEVHTAGLNFMNVMSALGIHPAYEGGAGPLGLECAGRICAIGDAAGEMKLGDEVLAIAFDSLATHVLADAQLVAPRPSGLSLEDAATVPISFVTAHYALHHLARLQPGERVLIHAAAGGVGLAALQIAQQMGAEVFATAGSPDKREFLCSLGVRHVMDSRALTFADEVREMTGGEGVDVVLNSLAGEAASLSLKALRPFGRLVEIGPGHLRGNLAWPRAPFGSGLSYFAIDLDRMIRERPLYVGSLLREVVALFEQGILRPLPTRMFPVGELTEAFGYLAEARHRGKVAVRVEGEDPSITLEAGPIGEVSGGTYLITGLGDLSLLVARWLGSQGARHLAILDGNGPTPPAKEALDALSRGGVDVRLLQGDLADEGQLARALAEIGQTMPRLQGIVHAAGILDETKAGGPGQGPREAELARRLTGAWNLHALTASHPVDLFVLFSSASSLLGSPGQATQAAGDAFLDALVAHRRARGLSGLSVSWGPWSELGEADARAEGSRVPTAPGRTSAAPQRIPPELPHPDEAPLAAGGPRLEPLSNPSLRPLDECTYAVGWPRAEREPHQGRRREGTGRWLILADRGGVGRALAELLRGRGDGCVTLFADEAGSREGLEGLLREKWRPEGTPQRGVVHLWSLDAPALDEMTPESLETAHARGCGSVLHLLRALAPAGGPRLWLVTQGAQPAGRSPSARGLAQAPLWGLGRVLALEQPESWGGLVDLDPEGATDAAQRLVEEITQPDGEDQVAFCGRERRVARLIREPLAAPEPGRLSEGTYLVTGGLGGIGLQVARWLVERGARHLVLTSRAGLPERSRWDEAMGESERKRVEAVRELEALGASVTVTAADVTDPRAMTSLFQAFGRALPSLRGVVHAAGVMTVSGLTELEVPALLDVLRPKVAGAWVLHELTRELELDFFVLFSSAAAVWGSKGLGHYAAANHFLDALAHHRRARGRPALSVNWGWLSGGGMTSVETEAFFRRVGLQEMDSAQTLGILGRLLGEGSVQKTVAAVDWDVFKSIYEAWGPRPLLQGLQTRLDLERDREPPCSCAGRAPMRAAHLNGCGLGSLNRGQALGALERIFRERPLQMAVMSFDLGHWRACHPTVPSAPLLTRLGQLPAPPAAGAEAGGPRRLGEALLAIEPGRLRRARLESHLREMVARVLKLPPARVDVNKPFRALGLDSLMALELRNRLEADLGLKLSATLVFNHPTVAALAPHLAECMGIPLEAPEATPVAVTAGEEAFARVLDEIEQMSVQEARRLLEEEHRPDEVGST